MTQENRLQAIERVRQRGGRPVRPVGSPARIEQRLTVLPWQQPAESQPPAKISFAPFVRGKIKKISFGAYLWFAVCVLLPVAVASTYYVFIASNQYVAEFRFAVKDTTPQTLTSLMGMISGGGDTYDNFVVVDYLTSRQAAEELRKRIDVTKLYSRPDIDWWARFNSSQPMEKFATYWQKMVTSEFDIISGLATARVRAFSPDDALLIANSLVTLSEELVNRMANRAQNDAVKFAQKDLDRAQDRLKAISAKLLEFRNRVGVIDPNASVIASNSSVEQSLRGNLAQLETQLTMFLGRNLQPNAPAILNLRNQIKATKDQLDALEKSVSATGKGAALTNVVSEYAQLDLERQFAQTMVTTTAQALDQARSTAATQHLYITPYVRPSLPASSTYPHRFTSVLVVAALSFLVWAASLLVVRSLRERFT